MDEHENLEDQVKKASTERLIELKRAFDDLKRTLAGQWAQQMDAFKEEREAMRIKRLAADKTSRLIAAEIARRADPE